MSSLTDVPLKTNSMRSLWPNRTGW